MDRRWRLSNLYVVIDKDGSRIPFPAQWRRGTARQPAFQNVILKARSSALRPSFSYFMLDALLVQLQHPRRTIATAR